MIKIPVGQTIRSAYDFTFSQLGAIIGLIWIPQLIVSVGGYLTALPYNSRIAAGDTTAAAASERLLAAFGEIVSLLLIAVMMVAVTRQALGLRTGPARAYFALGKPEFRLFSSVVVLAMLAVLFVFGMTLAATLLQSVPEPLGSVFDSVVTLGGFGAIIYAMTRLGFLVAPASVANEDYGIERSWILTRGNFWRILAVIVGAIGPISAVSILIFLYLVGPNFFPNDLSILNDPAALEQFQLKQAQILAQIQPAMLSLGFAFAPFTLGLWAGAAASAYKFLAENAKKSESDMTVA